MSDILVALIFLALVASPVITAVMQMHSTDEPETCTDNVDLRFPSTSSSR